MIVYASLINTFETSILRFNKKLFRKLEIKLRAFGLIFSIIATLGFYIAINYLYHISIDFKFTFMFLINTFLFTLINFEMYRFTKLEKQKTLLLVLIISGIINLSFSFFLVKEMVLFGAFLANTLGLFVNYILMRFFILKYAYHEI